MKKYILKTLAPVFSVSLFLVVFSLSVFLVYGYRYDFEENEVISTSVVDVCMTQQKADLYLDGELEGAGACSKFYGMDLGRHRLEVKKPGFYSWKKDFYLGSERVAVYKNILLVPRRELITAVKREEDPIIFFDNQEEDLNNPILVDGFEIWKKKGDTKSFITRYSTPIQSAQYFYNTSNLLIATTSEVYVCDFDAENCHLIVSKDVDSLVFHQLNTKEILFVKDEILKEISLNYSLEKVQGLEI